MALKDVFKKLNLSGIGGKLAGLKSKLRLGKKSSPSEALPGPEADASLVTPEEQAPSPIESPIDAAAQAEPGTDPMLEVPKPKFHHMLGEKLKGMAAKVGGLFRKRAPAEGAEAAASVSEPGIASADTGPSDAAAEAAAHGNFFQRLRATAGTRARELATNFKTGAVTLATQLKQNFPKNMEDLKKIQPDELLEKFSSLGGGRAFGTYLRMGAAAFAAYFLADTVSLFTDSMIPEPPTVPAPLVRTSNEKQRSINEYAKIIDNDIFSSTHTIPPDVQDPRIASKTNLPLNLIGTVVLRNPNNSIATIEDRSANTIYPVRVGDTVNGQIEIKLIEHLKVTFLNHTNNRMEYVEIVEDQPTMRIEPSRPARSSADGITKLDDTHVTVDQKVIRDGMANLNDVLQQARAIPNFENGLPDGYKILQIVPGSIFDKLGIKNGDVVVGLNGETVNDPGKALSLLNDLPNAKHVEIAVKRGGQRKTMSYDIQ